MGIGLACVVAGIAVYQVMVSAKHSVDHYVIGALVILALAFAGQLGDRFLDRFDRWGGR